MNANKYKFFRKSLFVRMFIILGVFTSSIYAEKNHMQEVEAIKGVHGGRLLGSKNFQTEITIYENNTAPQSRIYFYENNTPLDPSLVKFNMELHRIDKVDSINYKKQGEYLIGDKIIEEPHSFDVKVKAEYKGEVYHWSYSSYEGRTELSKETVETSGILTEISGPARIKSKIRFNGQIVVNDYNLLHVATRFAGIVKSINKKLGDSVEKDELLALIESNESLSVYEVRSKIKGTVIERKASAGEMLSAGEDIFVIADLNTVWVDLNVYREDIGKLEKGQKVYIYENKEDSKTAIAEISYISPVTTDESQTFLARAILENLDNNWRPGLFIQADVITEEREVPVAVNLSAVQVFRDWDVVFKQVGNVFEIAIVKLGQRDGDLVEVISGLEANTKYATENSFILKADVLKSGASHDH